MIAGVAWATCELTVQKQGCELQHVLGGAPGDAPPITITVGEAHQAENQRIQFLATSAICGDGSTESTSVSPNRV